MNVTAEQVRDAALAANLTEVENCRCSLCGVMTRYVIIDGELFFDPSCACTCVHVPLEPRSWSDAARLINRQGDHIGQEIAARFGFEDNTSAGGK